MKKYTSVKKQRGFFDFGLAVVLLASSSATAYVLTSDDSEEVAQQKIESVETVNVTTSDHTSANTNDEN